jgi:two-component system chemotaxis response regulator CheY
VAKERTMKKVLVVDDAGTVRMYHRKLLEEAGFEVDEAVNGLEALEKAMLTDYDLYIVDINLPQLDGYSFLQRLRGSEDLKQSPVLMVSTESEEQDKEKAFALGVNFYLFKPVKPVEFIKYCKLLTGVSYE